MVALSCGQPVGGSNRVSLTLTTPDDGSICAAQPCSRFGQGIEHSLQVEGGAADDLEDVPGRGQLARPRFQLGREFGLLATRLLKLTDKLGDSCFESDVGSLHAEAP